MTATTAITGGTQVRVARSEAHPAWSTVRLSLRLTRRGMLLMAVAAGAYIALEVLSFSTIYPNGVSSDQFAAFADNPAARMLQGVPRGIDTAAGFTVWDAGYVIELAVGAWAILTASRLMRGEEDTGRTELLLVGPIESGRATGLLLAVVYAGAALTGLSVGAALAVTGAQLLGSVVFGLGVMGFAATFAGVGAVVAQFVGVRRRAAGIASAVLATTFLLRMVANSTDERAWIAWLSPFGWMDQLAPFTEPSSLALALLLLTPALLAVATVVARRRRDTGGALLTRTDRREPRMSGLGGPMAFAWRTNRAVFAGWTVGLCAYAFVLGTLVTSTIDFLTQDEEYRRAMQRLGLDIALTTDGFLGVMSVVLGVGFALYAAFRLGATRTEEESGRAEHLLTRPVPRTRWLTDHVVLTLVGAALLTVLAGLSLWAGSVVEGADDVSLSDALASVANSGSVVVLVTGLGVLAFGLAPRLTLAVPLAVTVVGYVLALLGPALSWPNWVVDLSPFAHLAYVPAEPFATTSAATMALVGVGATIAGIAAFRHRDVTGA